MSDSNTNSVIDFIVIYILWLTDGDKVRSNYSDKDNPVVIVSRINHSEFVVKAKVSRGEKETDSLTSTKYRFQVTSLTP